MPLHLSASTLTSLPQVGNTHQAVLTDGMDHSYLRIRLESWQWVLQQAGLGTAAKHGGPSAAEHCCCWLLLLLRGILL
jgi:hypothetical protein